MSTWTSIADPQFIRLIVQRQTDETEEPVSCDTLMETQRFNLRYSYRSFRCSPTVWYIAPLFADDAPHFLREWKKKVRVAGPTRPSRSSWMTNKRSKVRPLAVIKIGKYTLKVAGIVIIRLGCLRSQVMHREL